MKIATWNIDRLKRKKDLIPIAESIQKIDADILILTEYNKILDLPNYKYQIETLKISENLDNYYFTHFGRNTFLQCFESNNLKNITENLKENIDHIVLSENFAKNFKYEIVEWNIDKKLSDHKGICLKLIRND